MRLVVEPLTLHLRQPFVIAHGASTTRENVLVRLDGGLGEAAAVTYLGETRERITSYLAGLDTSAWLDPLALDDLERSLPQGSAAARAAVDMALCDAFGQRLGQPLYRLLGLNPAASHRAPTRSRWAHPSKWRRRPVVPPCPS